MHCILSHRVVSYRLGLS